MIFKEQLAYRQKGSLAEREDWYRLCYDSSTGEFYVEHEWDYVNPYNVREASSGTSKHDAVSWDGEGADRLEEAKRALMAKAGT